MKTFDLIFLRVKIIPMVFISMLFRCLSFVLLATLFKFYSIFPIIWILWISHTTSVKVTSEQSFFFRLCNDDTASICWSLSSVFWAIGDIFVGPVLYPIKKHLWYVETFNKEQKRKHDMMRKRC